MITTFTAKTVGDIFNISLFDIKIELRCIPFVETHPPRATEQLYAKDVMKVNVKTVRSLENAFDVYEMLCTCKHNGFPVVSSSNKLKGMILRKQVYALIKNKAFYDDEESSLRTDEEGGNSPTRYLADEDYHGVFFESMIFKSGATVMSAQHLGLTSEEVEDLRIRKLNLKPYMSPFPLSVHEYTTLTRVYHLYRALGLRHLPVVDIENNVVGIISRKELMTHFDENLS
eukprot:CAMPEP_0115044296 /NCGR_PEP_ID=MMETSP0216-20121206/47390_1 /TAXON_ID=223996 /ORGANISM="Protocruzia adherens, Strain Boccale" /LENGTH=228 /DNA_ID=CAMNT_0002426801 /DNA_START=32 /DNA_END=718 /DNA_ORIENTATION=-